VFVVTDRNCRLRSPILFYSSKTAERRASCVRLSGNSQRARLPPWKERDSQVSGRLPRLRGCVDVVCGLFRDVKGANLLLDANLVVKLADFGVSAILQNEASGSSVAEVRVVLILPREFALQWGTYFFLPSRLSARLIGWLLRFVSDKFACSLSGIASPVISCNLVPDHSGATLREESGCVEVREAESLKRVFSP